MTLAGPLDVDAAEPCRAGKESVGTDAEAGRDDAADVLALGGDHIEGRRGAEVDDDTWPAVALKGGDAFDEAIGAEFRGIVNQYGHAGLDAGLDEHGLDAEVVFADLAKDGFDRRHDGRDDDVRYLVRRFAVHLKEIDEEHAVLIDSLVAMGGDAPVSYERRFWAIEAEEREHGV